MQIPAHHRKHTVAKFGGTSVATHAAMSRCAKIIMNHTNVRVVVVSAPAGVTNLLVKLTESQNNVQNIDQHLKEIQSKIVTISESISSSQTDKIPALQRAVMHMLEEIKNLSIKLNKKYDRSLADELLSYGERMSARLFACILLEHQLPANYIDARTLIKTNNIFGKAEVLIQETENQVRQLLLPACKHHIIVTEGFIGSTKENITTTLGRGGSDYSAALLAEAIHADTLQIWTDVPGIYTVDPRLVPKAKPIDNICFTEAAELAQFGAKVLHPATLWPAIRKNIPVFVGSSINAAAQGTWIRAAYPKEMDIPLVRAISLRRHQSLLTIHSLEMLHTHGFLAKIFTVLANHKLSVDLVTTSEVSVALTLNHAENQSIELLTPAILTELQTCGNISLTVDKDLCLIALIGNHLHLTSGISGRVFNKLKNFNIRLICHGASSHNLCFLVNESDANAIIQEIHSEFFENC